MICILGYRDDSLKTVAQNKEDYGIPLKILSYKELYGWTMDSIVAEVKAYLITFLFDLINIYLNDM